MYVLIQQFTKKLMLFLLLSVSTTSCNGLFGHNLESYEKAYFVLPDGDFMTVYIAKTPLQQKKGLSGVRKTDFMGNTGMLFPSKKMHMRQFWMPETYFNLDIVFMNQDYYILDIHRNLQSSPKKAQEIEEGDIKYSKMVFSQHVLELRSGSPMARKIRPGMVLKLTKKAPTP